MECKWRSYDGTYEGEVRQVKGKAVPHGCGRWTGKLREYKLIIEGEWKDGQVNGKAVNYYDDGEEVQWQTNNGWKCQKWIHFMKDGGHRQGQDEGVYTTWRKYDKDGAQVE